MAGNDDLSDIGGTPVDDLSDLGGVPVTMPSIPASPMLSAHGHPGHSVPQWVNTLGSVAKFGTSTIPPILGTLGGIGGAAGGPGGAIGGAALGWGGGELARRAINQASGLEPVEPAINNAIGVGGAAMMGGSGEGAAQAMSPLLTRLGNSMIEKSFSVIPSLMEKHPEILNTLRRLGLTADQSGVDKAEQLWWQAVNQRKAALLNARKAGGAVKVAKIMQDVVDDVNSRLDTPMSVGQRSQLLDKVRGTLQGAMAERSAGVQTMPGNASSLTPREGKQLIQILDEHLNPEYRAQLAGTANAANKSIEVPMRQSAREQLSANAPGYDEATQQLQDLMGPRAALQDVMSRPGRWVNVPLIPFLPQTMNLRVPMSPSVASRVGLGLMPGAAGRQVIQNIPRAATGLSWPLLFGRPLEPDTTTTK